MRFLDVSESLFLSESIHECYFCLSGTQFSPGETVSRITGVFYLKCELLVVDISFEIVLRNLIPPRQWSLLWSPNWNQNAAAFLGGAIVTKLSLEQPANTSCYRSVASNRNTLLTRLATPHRDFARVSLRRCTH
jgi:hypothetical protein